MFDWITNQVDVETLVTQAVGYVPKILGALILIVVFWALLIAVRRLLESSLTRAKVPETIRRLLSRFVKYAIVQCCPK